MNSLDHLAASRLMFEKEIAERNDLYLTNELDKMRVAHEAAFERVLADAESTAPFRLPVASRAGSETTPQLFRSRFSSGSRLSALALCGRAFMYGVAGGFVTIVAIYLINLIIISIQTMSN